MVLWMQAELAGDVRYHSSLPCISQWVNWIHSAKFLVKANLETFKQLNLKKEVHVCGKNKTIGMMLGAQMACELQDTRLYKKCPFWRGWEAKPSVPEISCQILILSLLRNWGHVLYLISHCCAECCGWDCGQTFHSLYRIFLDRKFVLSLCSISGAEEPDHAASASLHCPLMPWQHRPQGLHPISVFALWALSQIELCLLLTVLFS